MSVFQNFIPLCGCNQKDEQRKAQERLYCYLKDHRELFFDNLNRAKTIDYFLNVCFCEVSFLYVDEVLRSMFAGAANYGQFDIEYSIGAPWIAGDQQSEHFCYQPDMKDPRIDDATGNTAARHKTQTASY